LAELFFSGFLLLGGRVRKSEELNDIRATLEKHFKRTVDPTVLYGNSTVVSPTSEKTLQSFIGCGNPAFSHIVWTSNLRRMVVLAGTALAYGEPVLLVGETGSV
jgi:midasin (ATPase involved in ribosome maturation)